MSGYDQQEIHVSLYVEADRDKVVQKEIAALRSFHPSLPAQVYSKLRSFMTRPDLGGKGGDRVADGIQEFRGPTPKGCVVRLLWMDWNSQRVVLVVSCSKTDKIPQNDIDLAIRRRMLLLSRLGRK